MYLYSIKDFDIVFLLAFVIWFGAPWKFLIRKLYFYKFEKTRTIIKIKNSDDL